MKSFEKGGMAAGRRAASVVFLFWGVFTFLQGGCRGDRPGRNEVVVLVEASIEGLDPRFAVSGYGVKLSRLVAAPLVSVDTQDLSVKGELAERVEQTDAKTYVIHLRKEARFWDGRQVTARDVAATIESMKRVDSPSPYHAVWTRVAAIEVLDDESLRIRLSQPHSPFLTDLDVGILPADQVRNPRAIQDTKLMGAGPFHVVHRTRTTVVLETNPHYYGGRVRIRRLIVRSVQDDDARLLMLAGGSADFTQNTVPAMLLGAVAKRRDLVLRTGRSVTHTYVGFNLRHPELGHRKVRLAMALALDRKALVQAKLGGRARLATSILPEFAWAHPKNLVQVPYDPKRAERLLDEAGYGRAEAGGMRFSLVYKTSNNPFRVALARAMAAMWHKVGIDVEVRPYEWGVFYSDIKKSNFDLFSMQMTELTVPDYHYHFFHSASTVGRDLGAVCWREVEWLSEQMALCRVPQTAGCRLSPELLVVAKRHLPVMLDRLARFTYDLSIGRKDRSTVGANRFGYSNPEVDWLLDAARFFSDRQTLKVLYGRVQAILAVDLPIIFLWHEDNVAVMRRTLCGYRPLPNARWTPLAHVWKASRCPGSGR